MTTLRSFQAEIERISHEKQKQAIKEAREAHAAAELARHHGKVPVKKDVGEASTSQNGLNGVNGHGAQDGTNGDVNGEEPAEQTIEVSVHSLIAGQCASRRRADVYVGSDPLGLAGRVAVSDSGPPVAAPR